MLDSCFGTDNWKTKSLFNVLCACAVGVCSLYNSNLQFLAKSSFTGKITNERRSECSNPVTIKKAETLLRIVEIIDNSISITII